MSTVYLLRELAMALAMVLTLVLWMRIPRPRSRLFRLLGLLCLVELLVELIGFGAKITETHLTLQYNAYILFEFLVVLAMLKDQRPHWRGVLGVALAIGLTGLGWSIWLQGGMDTVLMEGAVVMALVLALLVVALLVDLSRNSEQALHYLPAFWLFMGLLVYFGGMLPVVGLVRMLYAQFPELAIRLWTIPPVLTVVRYLLAAHACRLEARQHL